MDMHSSGGRAGARSVGSRLARYALLLGVLGCANGVTGLGSSGETTQEPASAGAAGGSALEGTSDAWCLARAVLEAKCQRCHGTPTSNSAPFSLTSFDDTQATNKRGQPRFELIAQAISSQHMPPTFLVLEPEVAPLEELERGNLLAWCDAGAPPPSAPCD